METRRDERFIQTAEFPAMLFMCVMVLTGLAWGLHAGPSSASPLTISADPAPVIPTRVQYEQMGPDIRLICLVNGTSNVTWCKMTPDNESCSPFPWGSRDRLTTVGKELWLLNPYPEDSGLYRCASSDGEEQINLKIYSCDKDRRVEVQNRPDPRFAVSSGASVSLNCSAYFGCPPDFNESMLWQQLARWTWSPHSPSLASRLSVKSWPLDPDTMNSHAMLTVSHVTEADYGVKLRCDLGKGTLNASFTVEIVKPDKQPGDYWRLVVGIVVPLVLIFIIVLGILVYFRNVVKYRCWKRGLPKRGPGEEYDALILTTETTEQFTSQHLLPSLKNYRVQDVPANRRVLNFISEKLPECTCVIMVRGINDEDALWRFHAHAVCREKGTSRVVLVLVPDQDLGLSSSLSPEEDVREGGVQLGEGDRDGEGEEPTLAGCPKLRWPGNKSNRLRALEFWYGLRCALPPPQPPPPPKDRDVSSPRGHDSTTSGSYLLRPSSSRSDALSPDSAEVAEPAWQ